MKNLLAAVIFAILAGCSSTNYKPFEGRDTAYEGRGGTRTVMNGVDLWETGEPPRKYKILGIIEDERSGNLIHRSTFQGDVTKKAKESGGDGVIKIDANSQVTGTMSQGFATGRAYGNTANASGVGFSAPMSRTSSRFAVIKYLD
jgi:hypothetical protein